MLKISVFGSGSVGGPNWRPSENTWLLSLFGTNKMDFRGVRMETAGATIRGVALFGSVEICVPTGLPIEFGGITIFGSRRLKSAWSRVESQVFDENQRLRLSLLNIFGSVEVTEQA